MLGISTDEPKDEGCSGCEASTEPLAMSLHTALNSS